MHANPFDFSLSRPESQPLVDVLQGHVTGSPAPVASTTTDRFSGHLNVIDMCNIAGYRVSKSNNLGEHLVLRGSVLQLFHHVSVLERMKSSASR